MGEEGAKRDGETGGGDVKFSHPVVSKVLSKIAEIEKAKAEEASQVKAEQERVVAKEAKSPLRRKISRMVKVFLISLAFCSGVWYIATKSSLLKNWLLESFSILSGKIVGGRDTVWIRREVPGPPADKEFYSLEGKIKKDARGIPLYLGARGIRSTSEDNISTINFVTNGPIDRVMVFYKKEMEKRGYGLVKEDYSPGSNIGQFFFSREGKECTISLVKNGTGAVNVAISYME